MRGRTVLVWVVVAIIALLASARPAEACGDDWEFACWRWNSCLFDIFGICVGGPEPVPPNLGCGDRLNSIFGLCTPCGASWEPLCVFDPPACDSRNNPLGLCVPCGAQSEIFCWSSPVCDEHLRVVAGFCDYSGHSEEPDCDCSVAVVPEQPQGEPVRGFADVHVHQFANLGIGGALLWGATHHDGGIDKALAWCDATWEFVTLPGLLSWVQLPVQGFMVHGDVRSQQNECLLSTSCQSHEGVHEVGGTGDFEGWPKWSTTTHQQMYYKWLERAYKGGQRLMVQLAVNNEIACTISRKRWGWACNDMFNIDKQIEGAYDLEAFIDEQSGGPGEGWYRIVTTPAEARQVIEDGKMAVVLGIETDSMFNCKPGTSGCNEEYILEQVSKYYCKGIRHAFPVHLYDNRFSGTALYNDFWTIANLFLTGDFINPWDCSDYPNPTDPEVKKYNYKTAWVQALLAVYEFIYGWTPLPDWGPIDAHCNSTGLTTEGYVLANAMMDHGMIIDTDHLSLLGMTNMLELAELRNYPLVGGHTFLFEHPPMEFGNNPRTELHRTPEQLGRIRDLGGLVAPLNPHGKCSSTLDYVAKYKQIVEVMSEGEYFEEDGFPRIAFSTDFGGFFQQTAPRDLEPGDPDYCPDSRYTAQKNDPDDPYSFYHVQEGNDWIFKRPNHPDYPMLSYPFDAVGGFGTFWEQQTGDRTFNFNRDGLAHAGMVPDFIADLRNVGLTDEALEPLMNSAEAYIRMWEQVDDSSGDAVPRLRAEVDGTSGEFGWYVSDVTVSWNDVCDPETITYDTEGHEASCTVDSTCGPVTERETVKRDTVCPEVTSSVRLTPEPPSGWNNEVVEVRFQATDVTSGVIGESDVVVSVFGEGRDMMATHTFTDVAGLTEVAEFGGINIDVTPPLVGFRFEDAPELSPEEFAAETERWHNHDVVFEVVAVDELSGVSSITPDRIELSAEGPNVGSGTTAQDVAGNEVFVLSPTVKIDKTSPDLSCPTPVAVFPADGCPVPVGDSRIADFLAAATATDALDPAVEIEDDAPSSFGVGMTPVSFTAIDHAGNIDQCESAVEIINPFEDRDFFSVGRRQFVPGVGTLDSGAVYSVDTQSDGSVFAESMSSANTDAIDVLCNGDILFSVDARAGVHHGGGFTVLQPANVYTYEAETGVIRSFIDWNSLGIGVDSLIALDALEDGSVVFAVGRMRGVHHDGLFTVMRPGNLYRFDPSIGSLEMLFDGVALGIPSVDALDIVDESTVAFSTREVQALPHTGGFIVLRPENVYLVDLLNGNVSIAVNGSDWQLTSVDAFAAGAGTE